MENAFVGSLGLLRRFDENDQCLWLFREENRGLRLLQAERLEKESYREVVDREVAWTLRLARGRDFIVSSVPRAHYQGVILHPNGDEIYYVVECFIVDLFGRDGLSTLEEDPANRWLTTEEVLGGGFPEAPIDPLHQEFLKRTEAIGPDSFS